MGDTGITLCRQSIQLVLAEPAVKAYLDAVDTVANSNTFLLAAADHLDSLTPEEIYAYLDSEAFADAMFEADAERGWFNLHEPADSVEPIDSVRDFYVRQSGRFLCIQDATQLDVTPVSREELLAKLLWLLAGAPTPHSSNLPEQEAAPLVDDLLAIIEREGPIHKAALCEPNFISSEVPLMGEEDFESELLTYFEGANADVAAFFVAGSKGFVLLANGCA